jgi:hypothetical protein
VISDDERARIVGNVQKVVKISDSKGPKWRIRCGRVHHDSGTSLDNKLMLGTMARD